VVIPSVWLFRKNFDVRIDQQDCLDECFCRIAIVNVVKKENRLSVVVAEFLDIYGLAEPRRRVWNLQV
jgi:hypothetical protein